MGCYVLYLDGFLTFCEAHMIPRPTSIYHITSLTNLASIIHHGSLVCTNTLQRRNLAHTSIAYGHIQDVRARKPVPCGPCGVLHDYVPFYFAPRSPMLYTINRGNVPGYTQGQRPILHLVSTVEAVQAMNLPYVFTNGHGIVDFTMFFDDPNDLDQVDWAIMQSKYWNDIQEDNDRKRRRRAEFLVYGAFPWQLIAYIGVYDRTIKAQVDEILQDSVIKPIVACCPPWYY